MGKLGKFETEDVPKGKEFHASSRGNSNYKWQKGTHGVPIVGAFEVMSEPDLDYNEDLTPLSTGNDEHRDAFLRAQEAWETLKLSDSFLSACDSAPKERCCCGLLPDTEETKISLVKHLNASWTKDANKKLASTNITVDMFLWTWHNLTGKSESRVILIRFHDTAPISNYSR